MPGTLRPVRFLWSEIEAAWMAPSAEEHAA